VSRNKAVNHLRAVARIGIPLGGSLNRESEGIPRPYSSGLQGSSNVFCSQILANPAASGTGASLRFSKKNVSEPMEKGFGQQSVVVPCVYKASSIIYHPAGWCGIVVQGRSLHELDPCLQPEHLKHLLPQPRQRLLNHFDLV